MTGIEVENSSTATRANVDEVTVASFGHEWSHFDQKAMGDDELTAIFELYFYAFPWHLLPKDAVGFDMGCGSGRWARFVAPRVGHLNCIDASIDALDVAKRNLSGAHNVSFFLATANDATLAPASQDFGYSLGVLHHIPDTAGAMKECVKLLKPGAPFLVYLYYNFDNRPRWFRVIWKTSEALRIVICAMSPRWKVLVTTPIAALVYWPLARICWLGDKLGLDLRHVPLYGYRNRSFYVMRTDSRDRFGTPLEQRFSRDEIRKMMIDAGLDHIVIPDREPYWCAAGVRRE